MDRRAFWGVVAGSVLGTGAVCSASSEQAELQTEVLSLRQSLKEWKADYVDLFWSREGALESVEKLQAEIECQQEEYVWRREETINAWRDWYMRACRRIGEWREEAERLRALLRKSV